VWSMYHLVAFAAPHLIKTKGCIVNVSGVGSLSRGLGGWTPYCISKAGLNMLTVCISNELASHGVRVNGVIPGAFKPNNDKRADVMEAMDKKWVDMTSAHGLGRVGLFDELTRVVKFLASEDASFMTGANVPVDGGCLSLPIADFSK